MDENINIMKVPRVIILSLILWNLPSILLFNYGATLGSLISYTTIGLLLIYYLFEDKTTPNWFVIIISLLYFIISSFQYYDEPKYFINETLKFFVLLIGGYELLKRVSNEELFFFMLIGGLSIGIEALFYPSKFGRYSGFYLNPNEAGFICIFGYALIFSFKNKSIKLLGQFVFTLMGLLTFSRTFIVVWLFVNIISLVISIKNIRIIGIGFLIFSTLLIIDDVVGLNNPRFKQLKNIVYNENVSTEKISDDSRLETWAMFYDKIFESPILGSGYGSFSGKLGYLGVHNTYLMIVGEAGILPFILFIGYMGYLFYWSIYFFRKTPYLIMQTTALALFLLTDHNFFINYFVIFIAMWIQYQLVKQKKIYYDHTIEANTSKLD